MVRDITVRPIADRPQASGDTVPSSFGIMSLPHYPKGPAFAVLGPINDEGVWLAAFDRTRLPLDLVVQLLREQYGDIEYAVETMPAVTR